jgi:hypothetical protein
MALSRLHRVWIGENLNRTVAKFSTAILIGGNKDCFLLAFALSI